MNLSFSWPFLHFIPYFFFFPLHTWSSHSSLPLPHLSITTHFCLPMEIQHHYHSPYHSIPNFCGYIDCRLLIKDLTTNIHIQVSYIRFVFGDLVDLNQYDFFLPPSIFPQISWFHFFNSWVILHFMNVSRFFIYFFKILSLPVRLAKIIDKTKNSSCWWGCGVRGMLPLLVGV